MSQRLPAAESLDEGDRELGDAGGVLPERAEPARPSGFAEDVGHGSEIDPDSHREELASDDVGILPGGVGAGDRCDAGGFRPAREAFEGLSGEGVAAEAVAWIGGERDGDAETGACREVLERVVPIGDSRAVAPAEHVEVADAAGHHVQFGVAERIGVGERVTAGFGGGVEHEAGFFGD